MRLVSLEDEFCLEQVAGEQPSLLPEVHQESLPPRPGRPPVALLERELHDGLGAGAVLPAHLPDLEVDFAAAHPAGPTSPLDRPVDVGIAEDAAGEALPDRPVELSWHLVQRDRPG